MEIIGLKEAYEDAKAWSSARLGNSFSVYMNKETGKCWAEYESENDWVVFNNPNIVDLSSLVIRHERMITLKGLEAVAREVLSREKE
ncbi:hypothetical protein D1151_03085 [Emergencia sp. 1XD21-10]|nr:hypothetical protein [Emergencia sp. 1XD21-10]